MRFDNEAKDWDKNSRRVAVAKSVYEAIKKAIKIEKEFSILDFGCGTGLLSYNFKNDVKKIVGIDKSIKMVEEFNKKSNNKNIKAYCKDLKDVNETFDLIISSMTFHHIKDIENLLKNMKKILKKDGFICIADLEKEDGTFHDKGNEGVYHFGFEKKYLVDIFTKKGFKKIFEDRVFIIKKHRDFPVFLLCFKI